MTLVRRQRIAVFLAAAIASLVVLGWVASLTGPPVTNPSVAIVNATNLEVTSGLANAVVFPFQLAPDQQAGEEGTPTIGAASASITFSVSGCVAASAGPCPGVAVAIFTSDEAGEVAAGSNATPVWCGAMNGSSCGAQSSGQYTVDLTSLAGQGLDLVIWSSSGTEWVDVASTGSWSG
jgi:hypothetical protein